MAELPSYEQYVAEHKKNKEEYNQFWQSKGFIVDPSTRKPIRDPNYQDPTDVYKTQLGIRQAELNLQQDTNSLDPNKNINKIKAEAMAKAEAEAAATAKFPKAAAPTAESDKAVGFFNRFKSAEPDLMQSYQGLNRNEFLIGKALPNMLKSEGLQKFNQAARELIAANLRKESGAQISPAEFADALQRYIPVPGDKPGLIAQKAKTRSNILQGIAIEGSRTKPELGNLAHMAGVPMAIPGVTPTGVKATSVQVFKTLQQAEKASLPKGTQIEIDGRRAIVE